MANWLLNKMDKKRLFCNMINKKLLIAAASGVLILSACSEPEFSTDKEQFEAFLNVKRVPLNDAVRYERMKQEYEKRAALANAIYDGDALDKALIDAEIEEFRKELLISRYFETYLKGAVTDEGIQNYYKSNINNYQSKKTKVSHILFRTNARMSEEERQVVLTKAAEAYSKVNAGEKFSDVAKALSEDKVSAAKGGDLGWVNEGAISEGFSEKVFAMKSGEISQPFETDYGFHIIQLVEEPQDVTKSLESVKGDIRYQLRSESKKAEAKRLLDSVNYKQK